MFSVQKFEWTFFFFLVFKIFFCNFWFELYVFEFPNQNKKGTNFFFSMFENWELSHFGCSSRIWWLLVFLIWWFWLDFKLKECKLEVILDNPSSIWGGAFNLDLSWSQIFNVRISQQILLHFENVESVKRDEWFICLLLWFRRLYHLFLMRFLWPALILVWYLVFVWAVALDWSLGLGNWE